MHISDLPHLECGTQWHRDRAIGRGCPVDQKRREVAHKRTMLACFGVSTLFLASYLVYHYNAGSKHFPSYPPKAIRAFYLAMLASHILLAAAVPLLAITTIVLDCAGAEKRTANWRESPIQFGCTFPSQVCSCI